MVKETYSVISISSDLVLLKMYSIVLTLMLPKFGNVTNVGSHIKYLIFLVIKLYSFSLFAYVL